MKLIATRLPPLCLWAKAQPAATGIMAPRWLIMPTWQMPACGLEVAVVEGALDTVREALAAAQELAGQFVEQIGRLGPATVGLAEAEAGEGARRVEVDGEDGTQITVQGAQGVAGPQGEAGGHGGRLVAHLAVPLGHPTGEQQVLEPRVELAGEAHEGVAQEAVGRP